MPELNALVVAFVMRHAKLLNQDPIILGLPLSIVLGL